MTTENEIKTYKGPMYEIDLKQEWYCPYCYKKLVHKPKLDAVVCPTSQFECGFEHHNKEGRLKYKVVWHECKRYPVNLVDSLYLQLKVCNNRIAHYQKAIDSNQREALVLKKKIERLSKKGIVPLI